MQVMKKFKKNESGRDFVVGDLHGMYTLLMSQLDDIGFDKERDRLFCCGDLIDRGEESFECMMLMYEPWFHSVRGNHEQMMIDIYVHQQPDGGTWHYNGGMWELNYDQSEIRMYAHEIDHLLPYQIEIDGQIGIVHADVGNVWRELSDNDLVACLWNRSRINKIGVYKEYVTGIDKVYVGHTPTVGGKVVLGNVHYMDSGAVFTGGELRIEEIEYE